MPLPRLFDVGLDATISAKWSVPSAEIKEILAAFKQLRRLTNIWSNLLKTVPALFDQVYRVAVCKSCHISLRSKLSAKRLIHILLEWFEWVNVFLSP